MDSDYNTDIFYKYDDKENIINSSSLFTSITQSNNISNNFSETSYIDTRLSDIHKNLMNTDFQILKGGNSNLTTETLQLPLNYTEPLNSLTSFDYGIINKSTSSSVTNYSDSSSDAYLSKYKKIKRQEQKNKNNKKKRSGKKKKSSKKKIKKKK